MLSEAVGAGATIELSSVQCALPLADVYEKVGFAVEEDGEER